jgi:FkbM family methyltransferase
MKKLIKKLNLYNFFINLRDFLRIFYNQKRRNRFFWTILGGDKAHLANFDFDTNAILFDVGAHRGAYTNRLNEKFNCNIYSFEPVKEYFDYIENKFSENDNVKVFNIGLMDLDGKESISNIEGSSSFFPRKEGKADIPVNIRSISNFLMEERISNVDLMCVNIEGGEYRYLNDLIASGLIQKVDHLEIQFHNFVPNAKKLRKDLRLKLLETHQCKFNFPFVWERWDKK